MDNESKKRSARILIILGTLIIIATMVFQVAPSDPMSGLIKICTAIGIALDLMAGVLYLSIKHNK